MKIVIFIILAFLLPHFGFSQDFAIIKDKDGYVNIHSEPNIKSKIIGKIFKDSLFAYDGENTEWNYVSINFYGGYLHHSRIYPLSKFPSINQKRIFKDSCILKNDSIIVKIKTSKFITRNHTVSRKNGIVELVDGKKVWGQDGGLPKIAISAIEIIIKGRSIRLPKTAYSDLFEPTFSSARVHLGTSNIIYIQMQNSDGAGSYSVVWTIINGRYIKRNIDNSEV